MGVKRRRSDRAGRAPMRSPGRPPVTRREHRQRFWAAIARGLSSEDASVEAGVSIPVGVRWFREGGGMPPINQALLSGRYLSFVEREEIAMLRARGCGVREIARLVGRSPSTISRELRRNAATRSGSFEYRAMIAQWHADRRAKRPKTAKLASKPELQRYVKARLAGVIERPDRSSVSGPDVRWEGRRHVAVRTGVGRRRGALSRSQTGSASTSPMMSRCGSLTRRFTSRSMCRAVERCAASSPPVCAAAGRSESREPACAGVARTS